MHVVGSVPKLHPESLADPPRGMSHHRRSVGADNDRRSWMKSRIATSFALGEQLSWPRELVLSRTPLMLNPGVIGLLRRWGRKCKLACESPVTPLRDGGFSPRVTICESESDVARLEGNEGGAIVGDRDLEMV